MAITEQDVPDFEHDDTVGPRVDLPVEELLDISLEQHIGQRTPEGAFVVSTGEHTGRSAKDKYIVEPLPHGVFSGKIDYGEVNNPLRRGDYKKLFGDVGQYVFEKETFEQNLETGADPDYRQHVRLFATSPWHAAFASHLLIEPSGERKQELQRHQPDITIYHTPEFFADPAIHHTKGKTAIALDFDTGTIVIVGTSYAGEIKKAVFTYMQGELPAAGVATMHCAATTDEHGENTALYFGLSGTGKTTLSQDPGRKLVGDDEHAWGDRGVFNLEGGCYPKVINLSAVHEPEIYKATNRPGSILENVVLDKHGRPDFGNASRTENTRSAFSIQEQEGWTGMAPPPKNIIFLTADASGVLPPVARLTPEQAMYYLLSGYTSKVAGTEKGVTEPEPTFSTCFGAAFLPLKPQVYADLIGEKIRQHEPNVWLVNTGWSGEAYKNGSFDPKQRMSLSGVTRPIIRAITSGELSRVPTIPIPVFGLYMPIFCPGVVNSSFVLNPRSSWSKQRAYEEGSHQLARKFAENFAKKFADVAANILQAGPQV